MEDKRTYRRGEVYLASLDPRTGSEQGGTRPVLVLQNNAGNYFCPTLIVAPLTTNLSKKPQQPTHRFVDGSGALRPSLVMLEQITTIPLTANAAKAIPHRGGEQTMKPQDAYKLMFRDYPDVVNVEQLCRMLGGISSKTAYRLLKTSAIM